MASLRPSIAHPTATLAVFTLLASGRDVRAVASPTGLAVYMDGVLQWRADRDALHGRPSDYKRGALVGGRVFGSFLPEDARADTQAIEVVGTGGRVLRIDEPAKRYPGLEPVVFTDRRGELRFRAQGRAAHPPLDRRRRTHRDALGCDADRRDDGHGRLPDGGRSALFPLVDVGTIIHA